MKATGSLRRLPVAAASILLLNLCLLWAWRCHDYVMPRGWFVYVSGKPYGSLGETAERWRFGLVTKRWQRATSKVNLLGQWKSENGDFFCEFREDGIFRCAGKPHTRWGVQAKLIDGLPFFLADDVHYYIPHDRTGGTRSGMMTGPSFSLYEDVQDDENVCSGYIGTDGDSDQVFLMIDSIPYSIVYEKLVLIRAEGLTFPKLKRTR